MPDLDPRLTPARSDLAAAELKGRVEADRFVEAVDHQVIVPAAPIRRSAAPDGAMDDQLLAGEVFAVLDSANGWAWGWSRADGYVGHVELAHLGETVHATDRRITALRTYAFSKPDIKSAPRHLLSLNAAIAGGRREGRFVEATGLGWIVEAHTAASDTHASDFVAVAEAFLGAPYLWGGKESLGLDCSGLVQMSLEAAGVAAPRDTDMQEAALGRDVETDEALSGLRRGDLVFWPGHVGIMLDEARLIHANAHHMMTAIEPLREAVDRIGAKGTPLGRIKRL